MEEQEVVRNDPERDFLNQDNWLVLRGGMYCIKKSAIISYQIVTEDAYQYVKLRCANNVKFDLLEDDARDFMKILRAENGATYPFPRSHPNPEFAQG